MCDDAKKPMMLMGKPIHWVESLDGSPVSEEPIYAYSPCRTFLIAGKECEISTPDKDTDKVVMDLSKTKESK